MKIELIDSKAKKNSQQEDPPIEKKHIVKKSLVYHTGEKGTVLWS